jgi:plastocyanin
MNTKEKDKLTNQQGVILPLIILAVFAVLTAISYYIYQSNTPVLSQLKANIPGQTNTPVVKQQTMISSNPQIQITESGFSPTTITVTKGQVVSWTNTDSKPHHIVSDLESLPFDSDSLNTKDEYTYIFDTVGTYSYHDKLNPLKFKGVVVVK